MINILIYVAPSFGQSSVQFGQFNFNYNGTISNYSDWGAVDLTFTGSAHILYLNLVRDTGWVIENMPVATLHGVGNSQTQRFWFPIGIDGAPVSSISYGYTLTTNVLTSRPAVTNTGSVIQTFVKIFSGEPDHGGGGGTNKPPPAKKQEGGKATRSASHENFPNQEADKNACAPTGFSNSLKYLKDKHDLVGIPDGDISIGSLKTALDWSPTRKNPVDPNWVQLKKDYLASKNIAIETRQFDPKDIRFIEDEILSEQDVELFVQWKGGGAHLVSVTNFIPLGDGKYKLTITHDSEQENDTTGCVDENATYDSNTNEWGGALSNAEGGLNDFFFLVECPTHNLNQPGIMLPGGKYIRSKGNSSSRYNGRTIELNHLYLYDYSNFPSPPLDSTRVNNLTGTVSLDLSVNGGISFQHYIAAFSISVSFTHKINVDSTEYYSNEVLSMSISGGGLPPGFRIRESPTLASKGLTVIELAEPEKVKASYFDVFTEVSLDSGSTWIPEQNGFSSLFETYDSLFTIETSVTHVRCAGAHEGSINAVADGGVPPYRYSWSTGSTNCSISGLPAGIYSVTVTDEVSSVQTINIAVIDSGYACSGSSVVFDGFNYTAGNNAGLLLSGDSLIMANFGNNLRVSLNRDSNIFFHTWYHYDNLPGTRFTWERWGSLNNVPDQLISSETIDQVNDSVQSLTCNFVMADQVVVTFLYHGNIVAQQTISNGNTVFYERDCCSEKDNDYADEESGIVYLSQSKRDNQISYIQGERFDNIKVEGIYPVPVLSRTNHIEINALNIPGIVFKRNIGISVKGRLHCVGDSAIFTCTTESGAGLQWQKDFIDIPEATSSTYTASTGGNYGVKVLNLYYSSEDMGTPWKFETLDTLQPIRSYIITSSNLACSGTTVAFMATTVNGGDNPSFQWMLNGTPSGTNGPIYSYLPSNNDSITCIVTSSKICVTGNPATSNQIIMTVNTPPAPTGDAIQSFCAYTNPKVSDIVVSGSNIKWYDYNGIIIYDPGTITAINSTTYFASQSIDGCESSARIAITTTVIPAVEDAGAISGPVSFTPGSSGVVYSVAPITNANFYLWTYSGTGVTMNVMDNTAILDFSSSSTSGQLSVRGHNDCGMGNESSLSIVNNTDVKILNLSSVMLEGLYTHDGVMAQAYNENGPQWLADVADHINIELHSSLPGDYGTIVFIVTDIPLSTAGTATINVPAIFNGSYYITIKHRSSLTTVSATPVSFEGSSVSQSFGTPSDVFGGNLKRTFDGRYVIFGGEVYQDDLIDSWDAGLVDNKSAQAATGYLIEDVNGDGLVDSWDAGTIDNNSSQAIGSITPY